MHRIQSAHHLHVSPPHQPSPPLIASNPHITHRLSSNCHLHPSPPIRPSPLIIASALTIASTPPNVSAHRVRKTPSLRAVLWRIPPLIPCPPPPTMVPSLRAALWRIPSLIPCPSHPTLHSAQCLCSLRPKNASVEGHALAYPSPHPLPITSAFTLRSSHPKTCFLSASESKSEREREKG